jgi:hypothetical protein
MRSKIIKDKDGRYFVMTKGRFFFNRWRYARSKFDKLVLEFKSVAQAEEFIVYGKEPSRIKIIKDGI